MISESETVCPVCGSFLKYYDSVKRVVRTKRRQTRRIVIRRLRCQKCKTIHRALPAFIFPYKQYETEVILGVLEGLITSEVLGFEDYPAEITMDRWRSQKTQLLLWKSVK